MIEDALKSTRALHRLIMTVSLVSIIFALSVSLPADKERQKTIIDDLIAVDFAAYTGFVQEKVNVHVQTVLKPLADRLKEDLDNQGHLIFDLDKIAAEFEKPLHIGQILIDQLNLSEVNNASINSLNALNGLRLDQNAQVLVPRIVDLLDQINTFLRDNAKAGRRVDQVQASINDHDFTATSFLPEGEITAGIYFELLEPVNFGGTPVFSAAFSADTFELPDSSFTFWLQTQKINPGLVTVRNGEVVFGSDLDPAPPGFKTEKLGALSLRLSDELAKSSPANQTVSILGTNVPGSLAIFAAPIVLFALSYYFAAHTGHLARIASGEREEFQTFSWLPLSLRAKVVVSIPGFFPVSFSPAKSELITSAIVLPLAAIGILYFRLQEFGDIALLKIACLLAAAAAVLAFGCIALRNVSIARDAVASPPAQQTSTASAN